MRASTAYPHIKPNHMRKLYDEIVETIYRNTVLFTQKGLNAPQTIALIEEQPADTQASEFEAPAIFIDYKTEWKRRGKNYREGELLLDCHLILDNFSVTAAIDNTVESNRKRLDYYELVKMLLEGVYVDDAGKLSLIEEEFLFSALRRYRRMRFAAPITEEIISNYISISNVSPLINGKKL